MATSSSRGALALAWYESLTAYRGHDRVERRLSHGNVELQWDLQIFETMAIKMGVQRSILDWLERPEAVLLGLKSIGIGWEC